MDEKFKNIQSLKWLPWVGDNYLTLPLDKRLLIIGESHYHDGTEDSKRQCNSINITREVVEYFAVGRNYDRQRFFQNLHKTLFSHDNFDSEKLWNLISFYNFIQRPMETNLERPVYNDYYFGWSAFFEIFKQLQPSACLFVGATIANSLHHALDENKEFTADEIKWGDCINGTYARTTNLYFKDSSARLIFIKHTSKMFSWQQWNCYLQDAMNIHLKWLQTNIEF